MSTSAQPTLLQELTWLQKHERLLLGVLAAAVITFGIYKWDERAALDATSKAANAQQQVILAQKALDQQAAEANATIAELRAEKAQQQSAMQALAQTEASTQAALAAMVKKLATDNTPTELSQDIVTAYGPKMAPTVEPDQKIAFTVDQAKTLTLTKAQFDQLQVVDMAKDGVISSLQTTNNTQDKLIGQQQSELDTCKQVIVDTKKAAAIQINAVRAQARVGKIRAFFAGAGTVGAIVMGIMIHGAL